VLTPPAPKKNDLLARLAVMAVSFRLFQSDARSGTTLERFPASERRFVT
jgi:hypothetical protein